MHVPESQRAFLDKVQEVLRQYDAPLKDINHKVGISKFNDAFFPG